jgi:hypothetical protein
VTAAGRSRAIVVACGIALTACVMAWARSGDQTGAVARFLAAFGIAFAAYLVALHASSSVSARDVRLCVGVAIAWRIALVLAPPILSDDIYRYVWEGRIQLHGGNPYVWEDRPEGQRWVALRDGIWEGVTHKFYSALYPPAWQIAARAVVAAHDSVTMMKAFLVACELGALGLLAWVVKRRGLPPSRILVMAWSPLALVEIAGSGHNDAFGMLWLVAALAALESGRPALAAVASAVAFDAKILPGFVAAAWARRFRFWHIAVGAVVAAALFLPYLAAGSGLWHSAIRYARYWRFNETLFAVLRLALDVDSAVTASTLLLLAVAGVVAWRRTETARAGLIVVAASLLLAANVLPWYALWLLPFLVLADAPAALLFTGTVTLAYLAYPEWRSTGDWHVSWAVRALEYAPCAAVALLSRKR